MTHDDDTDALAIRLARALREQHASEHPHTDPDWTSVAETALATILTEPHVPERFLNPRVPMTVTIRAAHANRTISVRGYPTGTGVDGETATLEFLEITRARVHDSALRELDLTWAVQHDSPHASNSLTLDDARAELARLQAPDPTLPRTTNNTEEHP